MGRIEPAHGNQKLMRWTYLTMLYLYNLPCFLSMLSKKVCWYKIPFMNVTIGTCSYPMPADKQGTNISVYNS